MNSKLTFRSQDKSKAQRDEVPRKDDHTLVEVSGVKLKYECSFE
jgi:hypothetical protein